jgi:hypothetical protein
MSEHTQTGNGVEGQSVTGDKPKRKRAANRSPNVARPAFVVLQVLDEHGEAMPFPKGRINIVATERSAEKVMELLDGGIHPNAFYLRVIVPAGSRAGSPNRAKTD